METEKRPYNLIPTFGDSLGTGWNVMFDNFIRLFLIVIIMGIIAVPMKVLQIKVDPVNFHFGSWDWQDFFRFGTFCIFAAFYGLLAVLYAFLIVPVFRYGSRMIYVQAVRQQKPDFETLITGFRENYLSIVLASLLVTALIALGIIALIIPGIIIACRLAFVSYIVMDKKVDAIEAVEMSWKLTRGHGWTIFMMGFVSFFIIIFGLMLVFVGVFPAIIWIDSSFAALYESALKEKETPAEVKAD
jgi:hypothetical protein